MCGRNPWRCRCGPRPRCRRGRAARFRAIAFHVAVDMNLDDLVGREEAVADALLQRIGVNRLAEIVDVGDVFGLLRRGGEADLRGGGEIVEDFPPGRILGRAAAMAFVDHDQVEEAGRELAIELLALLRPGDRLIEAEIDFEGGVDAPLPVEREGQIDLGAVLPLDGLGVGRELRHRRAERAEVVHHRLVDQHVAVGEEQDALLAARLPQPPDDLERGVGLAGAGRHDQQDAVLALGDGLDRGVDGVDLIVARGLAAAVVEVVLKDDLSRLRRRGPSRRDSAPTDRRATERRRGRGSFRSGAAGRCGRGTRSRRRWRKTRRECPASRRSRGPAACRRRRCGCCPWPRSARSGCSACSRER